MSQTVNLNSQNFEIPSAGDDAWGDEVTNYLVALATGVLSKAGGDFALTAEADFGASFGLQSKYYKSRPVDGSNVELAVASAGAVRLGNNESVGWRDAADSSDKLLKVNASDQLEFDGNPLITLALGAADTVLRMNAAGTAYEFSKLTNANIDASAAIAYSKLNLAGSIINADIASAAAIAYSKLNLAGSVVDGDVSASAAIAWSKISKTGSDLADLTTKSHTSLSDIGTNTHSQIDTHIADATKHFTQSAISITASQVSDFDGAADARIAAASVDDLADVDTTGAANGDTLVFNSTTGNWEPGAAATGSGKNYITNPSASGDTSDWSESGSGTLSRTTTAANLPRANTTGSAFQFTSTAANDYAYTNFTLDEADLRAANLLVKLAAIVADASTWKVQLYAYSDSARTADETEIPLVDADSAGDWFLAATTAEFTTWWTPNPSLPYMQLRIVDTAGGNTLYWSDTLVGPGDAVSGAVVGPRTPYTPDDSVNQGLGTLSSVDLWWTRIGEHMLLEGRFTLGTVAASEARLALPDGFTIGSLTNGHPLGTWTRGGAVSSTYKAGNVIAAEGNNYVTFSTAEYSDAINSFSARNASDIWSNTAGIGIQNVLIPIAEWAGSGTVGLGTNRVEYVSHDGTNIVYGPAGADIPTSTPSGSNEAYDISAGFTNIQPTDQFRLEIQREGSGAWTTCDGVNIAHLTNDGTNYIGAAVYKSSATTIKMIRGKYRQPLTVAWSGLAAGTKWRVVKHSAGVVTGYGQASADTYGLVKGGKVPGVTDGSVREAGYVGESTESIVTTLTNATGAYQNLASITLTAGDWDISAMASLFFNTASVEYMEMAISTNSASITGTQYGYDYLQHFINASAGSSRNSTATIPRKVVSITADTTYYLVVKAVYASATAQWRGNISARRVR